VFFFFFWKKIIVLQTKLKLQSGFIAPLLDTPLLLVYA